MPPRFQPNHNMVTRPLQSETLALNRILGTDILEHSSRILDHFATTGTSQLGGGLKGAEPPRLLIEKLLEKCDDFDAVCDQIYYILEQSKKVLQLQYQQINVTNAKKKLEAEQQQQQQQKEEEQKSSLAAAASLDDDLSLGFNTGNGNNSHGDSNNGNNNGSNNTNGDLMEVDDATNNLDVEMIDQHGSNGTSNGTQGDGGHSNNKGMDSTGSSRNANHGGRPQHVDDDEEWDELLQQQKERLDRIKKVMALGMDAATVNAEGGKVSQDDLLF
ncbi:hypothetical protein [Absidia glauca]|uniref:Uncharacterized protein n=1 Tax=Absidia glauca TaxID=4829 RepID=A0A170APG2_ABSGL|nr:hypothetical protein [Absidia glauca]